MTVESWLSAALADVERRGLAAMKPMLETLARSLAALREADDKQLAGDVDAPAGDDRA